MVDGGGGDWSGVFGWRGLKAMNVADINGNHSASDLSELEAILSRRRPGNFNTFWLATESGGFPLLMILVKRDLAVLHYLPVEDLPGLRSMGEVRSRELIHFSISQNSADDIQEPSDALVTLGTAWEAAKEFFASRQLPRSVKWEEL